MNNIDSKVLESLLINEEDLIPANEGIGQDLASIFIPGIILVGGALAYNKYLEKKEDKMKAQKNAAAKKKYEEENYVFIKELNNRYHFMVSNDAYNKFINSILSDMEKDIKKMVSVANRDSKRFQVIADKLKSKWNYSDNEIKALGLGANYYKCYDVDDYWVIIEDQDVACVDDLHYTITEALNAKAMQDKRYNLVSLSNGDGDEGCVYYNYFSYETMKKKYPGIT